MAHPSGNVVPERLKHYQLVKRIGQGGMGMVFEGQDRRNNERVAVKLLYPHLVERDPTFLERFEREAHVAALLRSPYTVHVQDFGTEQGFTFLVMEFIDGETLLGILSRGPIEPDSALRVAGEVAHALEEAASRGIVHRDIKPENILIDREGHVKVTDFGIARSALSPGMTMTGGFVGTPAYAAPEQLDGKVDARTDIYALGATLYHMLAGQQPFTGRSDIDVLMKHRDAPLPSGPLAGLPSAATNIVRRCMEKDPLDRYQSPGELAGAITRGRQALARSATETPKPAPMTATIIGALRPPEEVIEERPASAVIGGSVGPAAVAPAQPASEGLPPVLPPGAKPQEELPDTAERRRPRQRPAEAGAVPPVQPPPSRVQAPPSRAIQPPPPRLVQPAPSRAQPAAISRVPPPAPQPAPAASRVDSAPARGAAPAASAGRTAPGKARRPGQWKAVLGTLAGVAVVGALIGGLLAAFGGGGDDEADAPAETRTRSATRTPTPESPTATPSPTAQLLPSVTPPAGSQSQLASGVRARVVGPGCNLKAYQEPTMGPDAKVVDTLCAGDTVVVATNTPAASTLNLGEGWIWWRVQNEKSKATYWVPEVTQAGTSRFLERAQ
jgi:serine/threonine protein kinase